MRPSPLPFSGKPIFALVFWCAFAAWILPEIIAWKARRSTHSSDSRDRGSLGLIVFLWWIGIAMDLLFSLFLPHAAILGKQTPLFFTGIGLMLLGIALRWYSVWLLGKYFTLTSPYTKDKF